LLSIPVARGAKHTPTTTTRGRSFVGVSGWDYPHWKGLFYPRELPKRRWLEHAARTFPTLELNGTFYSLKRPEHFARWCAVVDEVRGDDGFVFAVKGSRFVTHMNQLKDVDTALANFWASGLLALGARTGPFLWQLPERVSFNPERLERFFSLLPRTLGEAAALARRHDERLAGRALVDVDDDLRDQPLLHCCEPRHPGFFTKEARALLRDRDISFVLADSAGKFPMEPAPGPFGFVYVRLHGSKELYLSRYSDDELAAWAARVHGWNDDGRDVYVYFDNDGRGHAPWDAQRLVKAIAALDGRAGDDAVPAPA
jgi:uncharacterized protein YecE (DUF72 family)